MGMALFLFSCVLLCWALKTKQREDSCGDTREVLCPLGRPRGQLRAEAERSPLRTRGCPRERVGLMQQENVFS